MAAVRILYLEDDAMLGMATARLIGSLGEIEHVRTIEDALDELDNAQYDLCILDAWIAGRLSVEVADAAAKRGIRLVLVSGGEMPHDFLGHADNSIYLQKPVAFATWRSTLQACSGQSS